MRFLDLIARKRDGLRHTPDELELIVSAAASGEVPDYQLSAWLMAVVCRGMDEKETVAFTRAMARSGDALDLSRLSAPKVDKHSTGGVGDGISLALAPLLAEAGVVVPMMSGRGLGHTGGTLDKLESIPGLNVRLTLPQISAQLAELGTAMFGQTERLAPADRKLYALRDATATVPALPLIVGSILSKKLAEGLDALVLDVKVGSGAIFETEAEAAKLAQALVSTAKRLGLPTVGVLTAMDQPLGRAVGNALEMRQSIEVLQGDLSAEDFVECLLTLGGWMLKLCGRARTPEAGAASLEKLLRSGAAAARLARMIDAQGGDARVVREPGLLKPSAKSRAYVAGRSGYLSCLDARAVGEAAVLLGAGRAKADDVLDYGAGLMLSRKVGDRVQKGETIALLYASDEGKFAQAIERLTPGVEVAARAPRPRALVRRVIR